jgi:hypothetical protein
VSASPHFDRQTQRRSHLFGFGLQFDPRTTGVSVLHRQYFQRPLCFAPRSLERQSPVWTGPLAGSNIVRTARRNSFSDRESKYNSPGQSVQVPGRKFQAPDFQPQLTPFLTNSAIEPNSFDNRMPYTFDPLFVEDPLSSGNNVGRNAFRIVQVQRAFSDAHRALVAALEWDMHSSEDLQNTNDFPLLKCLLQSEDIVYDL